MQLKSHWKKERREKEIDEQKKLEEAEAISEDADDTDASDK